MRKILYSPGYGAGWTSWHNGSRKELQFMLQYQPFIDFLEDDNEFPESEKEIENLPVVKQFINDWINKFETRLPYLGGLTDLAIEEVDDGCLVRITDHDGYEEIEVSNNDWL